MDLPPPLARALAELGFTAPTPVQAAATPAMLAGRDVLARAPTGSGKTIAFGVPLLAGLRADAGLQALVVCPTRELAAQVARVLRQVGRHLPGLRVLVLAGGEPLGPQAASLERGAHVVVGTPGRLFDHLRRGTLELGGLALLVLDEADRMLDMGFGEQVETVVAATPADRRTALFSATFPDEIRALAERHLRDPVVVDVAGEGPAIRHVAVETEDRPAALLAVLRHHRPASALVFCNFKVSIATVVEALREAGEPAEALHGDLEQRDRDRVLAKLRNGSARVVVATDVAARGLDVAGLDLVVHLELPGDPDVYVHRSGRTGRAGQAGLAVSLVGPREQGKLRRIAEATGIAFEDEPVPAMGPPLPPPPFVTLWIGAGRKDKLRPGDVQGALTGEAGLPREQVGRIEIHDRFAYVAVAREAADAALAGLDRIKGRRVRVERAG